MTLSQPAAKTGRKAKPSQPRTTSRLAKARPKKGNHRSVEFLVKPRAVKIRLVPADLGSNAGQFAGTWSDKAEMPRLRDDVVFGLS